MPQFHQGHDIVGPARRGDITGAAIVRLLLIFVCAAALLPIAHASAAITFPDLSNNDPTQNMGAIKAAGHPAIWLKTNQGTWVDPTYSGMVRAARGAGLAVGGYDFVADYSVAEAQTFVNTLRATHTCTERNTLPPTLDVEFNSASRSGVQTMLNIVQGACGRVAIYTGGWYWLPHLGTWLPSSPNHSHIWLWISGYPLVIGWPFYVDIHQYTDHGFNGANTGDMNVFQGNAAGWASLINAVPPKPLTCQQKFDAQRVVLKARLAGDYKLQFGLSIRVRKLTAEIVTRVHARQTSTNVARLRGARRARYGATQQLKRTHADVLSTRNALRAKSPCKGR